MRASHWRGPLAAEQLRVPAHLSYVEELLLAPKSGISTTSVRDAERRASFAALVDAHQGDVLRICYVILGNVAHAEDASQAAWVKAWNNFHKLREPRKVRSWLVAIAANEARQLARRIRVLAGEPARPFASDADPDLIDLSTALSRLSPDERRLLGMRYALGLSSPEIGEALGLSAGAVRHRLMRLLARIREDMT